jgi:hypothetical protein
VGGWDRGVHGGGVRLRLEPFRGRLAGLDDAEYFWEPVTTIAWRIGHRWWRPIGPAFGLGWG